jgi:antitoxin (DNA-binding transcriptional repressor) of toxin-antitoxin stability system
MRSVGIKALKNDLSRHIRAVAGGEVVLVTDRGKVVAEIIPPRVGEDASSEERFLAQLEREGVLKRAKRRLTKDTLPPRRPPIMTFEEMMRDLDDSRSDR